MALAGKKAKILAYSAAVSMTAEATTTSDNITYQITNTAKRILCRDCTITVDDGGSPTVEIYTLDRLTGRVTFGSAVVRVITIDGYYLPVTTVANANEYTWSCSADNADSTVFESEFIDRAQTIKDFAASISQFYEVSNYFYDLLIGDGQFVLEFYSVGTSSPDVRAWAKIASDEVSGAVDGLIEESLDFEGTNDADNRAVSFGAF
jgi:hypothetical protein